MTIDHTPTTTPRPNAANKAPGSVSPAGPVLHGEEQPSHQRAGDGRWAVGVVDVQNDFCEGGSLAVEGGAEVAGRIRGWLDTSADRWVARFATADRHPAGLVGHFTPDGVVPEPPATWPAHCVAGTTGSELHLDLLRGAHEGDLFDTMVAKGQASAAFSGFEGTTADGTTLTEWLRDREVDGVEVCGIATDHCVRATAADALDAGFRVRVITDLCAGIDPASVEHALADLAAAGAEITTTTELDAVAIAGHDARSTRADR
jgi:nicotinamidase/pyrazinamidase